VILDTSAVVAIFLREPGFEALVGKIAESDGVGIGIPSLVELGIVLSARLHRDARPLIDRFLQEGAIQPVPFGEDHWRIAVGAYLRFGRARHPAGLNFGDCLAYATAKLARQPLLCVGDDFPQTDLPLA